MSGTWTSSGNIITARTGLSAGGNSSNAIALCGIISSTKSKKAETFGGTTWSSITDLATARDGVGVGGNSTDAIIDGGNTTARVATVEKWNGSAWSSLTSLTTSRNLHASGGNSADSFVAGGWVTSYSNNTEKFNGSTWPAGPNLITARYWHSGGGGSSDAIVVAGHTSVDLTSAEKNNGVAWSSMGSIVTARGGNATGGSSSNAMTAGGWYPSTVLSSTEEWTGRVWRVGGNLNTARERLAGAGNISAFTCGGNTTNGNLGTVTAATELYSGSGISRSEASNRVSASSRRYRIAPRVLTNPPTVLTTPTYDGSGQAVHPSVVCIPGGFAGYTHWMAMNPYPGGNDAYENPSLLASNDGTTWVVPTGITNPLAGKPSQHNSDACLVWNPDAGKLYLYYVELAAAYHIYRFEISENPLSVATKVELTISNPAMYSPAVCYNGPGDWVMWYVKVAGYPERRTSTDGLTWSTETIPVFYRMGYQYRTDWTIWHLSVSKIDDGSGRYLFIVTAYPNGSGSSNTRLFYGIAENLTAPIYFNDVTILAPFTGWGARQVYQSCVVKMADGSYKLYISAATADSVWRIGYADVVLW